MRKVVLATALLFSLTACGSSSGSPSSKSSVDVPAKALDVTAEANLRKAESTAALYFTETNDFSQITPTDMSVAGSSLTFVGDGASSTKPSQVSIFANSAGQLTMAAKSSSGACYYLRSSPAQTPASTQAIGVGTSCAATDQVAFSERAWS